MRQHLDIWLLASACVSLLLITVLHLFAFANLDSALDQLPVRSQLLDVLRGSWVLYGAHLLIAALLCALSAIWPARFGRGLRAALALWMSIDAVLMFYFVGVFLGSVLTTAVAIVLLLAAALPVRQGSAKTPHSKPS